jgi:hypothetical protein
MADINYIPRESARPTPAAGFGPRESVLIDASVWPNVAQRISLEERLLAHTCPFGAEHRRERITEEDLRLLLLISHERFGGEHALLRSQAVRALGRLKSQEARERLRELAFDLAEHDQIRVAALSGLELKDERLLQQLAEDISPAIRAFASRLIGGNKRGCREKPRRIPEDHEGDDEVVCCCCNVVK